VSEFQLPQRAKGKTLIIDRVIKYLGARIGQDVHIGDMVKDLDLRDTQIRAAIYSARERNPQLQQDVRVIVNGRMWRYLPSPLAATLGEHREVSNDGADVAEAPPPERKIRPVPRSPITQTIAVAQQPAAPPNRFLYEHVGNFNGKVIVRDENGQCYQIEPIDLNLT